MRTIVTTFNLIWHILKINTLCVTYVILVMDQSSQIKEQRKKDRLFKNPHNITFTTTQFVFGCFIEKSHV